MSNLYYIQLPVDWAVATSYVISLRFTREKIQYSIFKHFDGWIVY